jgi:hypothetical protein
MRKGFDSTVKICVLVVFAISLFFVASCRKSSPQTPPSRQTEGRAEKPAADVNKAPATPTTPEPVPQMPASTDKKDVQGATKTPTDTTSKQTPDTNTAAPAGWVPIEIKLPKPMFVGTPQDTRVANLEKPMGRARPPFLAPTGVKNVAAGKPVTSSDEEPIIGEIEMITDGDKEAADGSYVELGPLLQHVTIDLEAVQEIYAILVWHYHKQARVYYDVVVQVADDADFITNVKTVFNNDIDNSAGLGVGSNMHYTETNEGKLIDAKGVRARYVRLYSNGNTGNDLNHYIEVEVYGKPVQ